MDNLARTLEEAVQFVFNKMDDKDKDIISKMKEENLFRLHHGFGTSIRNDLGLWQWEDNSELLKSIEQSQEYADLEKQLEKDGILMDAEERSPDIHPDDASMVIIRALWKKLQGPVEKPLNRYQILKNNKNIT
jgi:hypothetical protein